MYCLPSSHLAAHWHPLPLTVKLVEPSDGLLLDTVHLYCPPSLPVTVRVWVYCAVIGLSNTDVPPGTVSEPLVQVTLVAGPPVEVQAMVNRGLSPLRSEFTVSFVRDTVTSPEE